MPELFFYLLYLLIIILVFGSMAVASFRAAPFVPTRKKDLERLVELADIKKGDLIYELGSGDGRILFEIAKRYEAKIIGYEISVVPYLVSKIRLWLLNNIFVHKLRGEIQILYKDFYLQNLKRADVVICFLIPKAMKELAPKFKQELKKDSRVVSYVFPIKSITPKEISKPTRSSNPIYLYSFRG